MSGWCPDPSPIYFFAEYDLSSTGVRAIDMTLACDEYSSWTYCRPLVHNCIEI